VQKSMALPWAPRSGQRQYESLTMSPGKTVTVNVGGGDIARHACIHPSTTDNSGELRSPPCLSSIVGQNTYLASIAELRNLPRDEKLKIIRDALGRLGG